MPSAWGKIAKPDAAKLTDIMSEDIAKAQQKKLSQKADRISEPLVDECSALPEEFLSYFDEGNDAEIAKILQEQYDNEHLQYTEENVKDNNNISASLFNYEREHNSERTQNDSDSEFDEMEDVRVGKEWHKYDSEKDRRSVTMLSGSRAGVKNSYRKPPCPSIYDTKASKLSNKVSNSLMNQSKQERQRNKRVHDRKEDHATSDFGVDQFTRLLLHGLISNQVLENVNGTISIGKESVVLHGELFQSGQECVIKVFKTTLSEFKQRDQYIKEDYRFEDRVGKQTARQTVRLWAEKELHNLNRVRAAGVPCPKVIELKKHVLLMTFIGSNHVAAPKLKDASLTDAEYQVAYDQVIRAMGTMYKKAKLVHADLSEYNILWYEGKCYLIDFAQSVEPNHCNAFYFLFRDCGNISNFFSRKGVPDVQSAEQIFRDIVGCEYKEKVELLQMQGNTKLKQHLADRPEVNTDYHFDTAWDLSKQKKSD